MARRTDARPGWCQDPTCTPQARTQDARVGGSGFCCGQTQELMISERRGVRHENDGHFCIKSARGIVMLEICAADLEVIARNALRSLVTRDPGRLFGARWYTGRPTWSDTLEETIVPVSPGGEE